jgi:hypothetical protein
MSDLSLQEGVSSCKTLPDFNHNTTESTSYPLSLTAETVNVENTDTCTKDLKPKKSVRRNRNALLNTLPLYSAAVARESGSKPEMKTHVPAQKCNSNCRYGLTCTDSSSDDFKKGTKVPWPDQVGSISADGIKVSINKCDSSFQLREEDFPPL